MREINAENAAQYLRDTNRIGAAEYVAVRELTGGVSNVVLYVERKDELDFVFKQAREQLRVPDPWFCAVERIWCEVATLRLCRIAIDKQKLDTRVGLSFVVPVVLFEDRDNFAFAMTAAPPHQVWKDQLLVGTTDVEVARSCGRLLGAIHTATWNDVNVARELDDTTFFRDLRIDPYYKQIVRVHRHLAGPIQDLIDAHSSHRHCLVHGDFSPKNLLIHPKGIVLVDCEVGHFGDPAFDLGFFLSHLTLKAFHAAPNFASHLKLIDEFWRAYRDRLRPCIAADDWESLDRRAMDSFVACLLARVDGKSQIDYLDERRRSSVRELALPLIENQGIAFSERFDTVARYLDRRMKDE